MLHVTNGDSVIGTLASTEIPGPRIAWDDPLHEGPVPARLFPAELNEIRARFIAECGWSTHEAALERFDARDRALSAAGDHDEIVLWFEPDLFCQLQLVQVLDRLAALDRRGGVTLICPPAHLGGLDPAELAALFPARAPIGDAVFDLAVHAWTAFRAPEPTGVAALLNEEMPGLPYLAGALRRHLEQLPSTHDGLARTERQILEVVAGGSDTWEEVFRGEQAREEWIFLGDLAFESWLRRLEGGGALEGLALTRLGAALLAGDADWVEAAGIRRWLGGVHLAGPGVPWRWDLAEQRLVERANV